MIQVALRAGAWIEMLAAESEVPQEIRRSPRGNNHPVRQYNQKCPCSWTKSMGITM